MSPPAPSSLPLPDEVVEALGGTPPGLVRGPSPGWRLPPPLRRRVRGFDARVDRSFDRLRGRHPAVDRLFYAASELGNFSLLWHLLAVAKGLRSERDRRGTARLAVGLLLESVLVNGALKSRVRRQRPVWDQVRPYRLRHPATSSFPSGHASSAFFAAALLSEGDPAWRLTYPVAAVVASSRIHVGIHHASDVVAGAALGLAAGHVVRRLWPLPPATREGGIDDGGVMLGQA